VLDFHQLPPLCTLHPGSRCTLYGFSIIDFILNVGERFVNEKGSLTNQAAF